MLGHFLFCVPVIDVRRDSGLRVHGLAGLKRHWPSGRPGFHEARCQAAQAQVNEGESPRSITASLAARRRSGGPAAGSHPSRRVESGVDDWGYRDPSCYIELFSIVA